ncbi:hypothetical protein [Enterovibrio gelatinilyticus]|uniref:hypothetical protein n=1 Tax=Enterovibrio gelatinilyticus TaxID=2899819 RepID=UPI0030822162
MSEFLSGIIASVSANTFSDLFIYLIGIVFAASFFMAVKGKGKGFVSGAPNLMTSLGILGTFVGIVVGLMEFDPQNIDGSIELLLAGLKTAFLTSLVGMCANILFKAIEPFIPSKEMAVEGVGPDEIHAVMSQQLKVSESLVESIRGDEDSSMTSQTRLMRADFNDGMKFIQSWLTEANKQNKQGLEHLDQMRQSHVVFSERLWIKMDEFGDMLSKSATEQVINALKEVIVDFNNNLTEQFGENFKRLDESVKKLVDWQENYRQQLEEMAHKYQLGVDAISSTEKSVAHISERTESIPQTMEKLHTVMELGHGQVTELEQRLDAFKDLRDKAVEAMPEIKRQLDDTMSVISTSVNAASAHYETMLAESKAMIESFSDEQKQATQQFTQSTGQGIETMTTELGSALNNMNESISKTIESTGNQLLVTVEDSMGKVTTSVDATSTTFERLATETNNTIEQYTTSAKETLKAANEHLEIARDETRSALDSFSSKVTETVDFVGQSLIENTEKVLGKVSHTVEESVDTFEQMNEASQSLIEQYGRDFTNALDSYSATVHGSLNTIKYEMDAGAVAMSDELKQGALEIGGKLAQSADEITSNVGDASGRLQSIVDHLTYQTEEIKEHLRLTMEDLNENVREMVIDLKENSEATMKILIQGNMDLGQNTQQTQQHMVQGIKELQNRLEGVLEEVFEAQVREVKRTFESLEEQVIDSVAQTGQAVEKQVEVLDLQMQQEINRVINEMGQGLATVTQQFTRDYGKLTNEMKAVVSNVTKLAS